MNKKLFFVGAMFFANLLFAGQMTSVGTYRYAGNLEEEIFYIGDGIAVLRDVQPDADSAKIYYSICKCEWINSPELDDQTGDSIHEILITNISLMSWLRDQGVFVGKSTAMNGRAKLQYFIVEIKTKKVEFYSNEKDFSAVLKKRGVEAVKLIPSEIFFRKVVYENLGVDEILYKRSEANDAKELKSKDRWLKEK